MKKSTLFLLSALAIITTMFSGCEVIGGIFKAGMWTGTILVVLVIALVIFIIAKLSSRNKN